VITEARGSAAITVAAAAVKVGTVTAAARPVADMVPQREVAATASPDLSQVAIVWSDRL
jgi:antitoxin (DNA-binding transcriptional repressor) of toxin-antitoxin stability system